MKSKRTGNQTHTNTSNIRPRPIQKRNHMFPLGDCTFQAWIIRISGKQRQDLRACLCRSGSSVLVDDGLESCDSTNGLGGAGSGYEMLGCLFKRIEWDDISIIDSRLEHINNSTIRPSIYLATIIQKGPTKTARKRELLRKDNILDMIHIIIVNQPQIRRTSPIA